MDICWLCDSEGKVSYIWCDTGLEYQATKDHLKYLEDKYKIEITCDKTATIEEIMQDFIQISI